MTAPGLESLGRALIMFGAVMAGFGALLMVAPKFPWIGRLPGDLFIQRGPFTVYVPLASCLLASVLLSVVWWVIGRLR